MDVHFKLTAAPREINYPIEATFHTDGGVVRGPFAYSIAEIVDILLEKAVPTKNTGAILPKNTVFYNSHSLFYRIGIVQDKQKAFIRYSEHTNTERIVEIAFPRLLLVYDLIQVTDKFRLQSAKIFSVKEDEEINEDSQLYRFPYPNVSKDCGSVCWGANNVVTIPSLKDIEQIFHVFVSAPFNEDYGTSLLINDNKNIQTFKSVIEYMQNHDHFKDDWLIPSSFTLKNVL